MTGIRRCLLVLLVILSPTVACSEPRQADQSDPQEHAPQGCPSQRQIPSETISGSRPVMTQDATSEDHTRAPQKKNKKDNCPGQQTKRMFWVVPNFAAVSADKQLPPLSTRQKFVLAMHDSVDYSSFVWTGVIAAQSYGLNSDSELGSGIAGYGRYYWRAYADGVSGTFFTEAIVPALTHEDPRYYTLGHGGFFRRTYYALSRTVLTKTDSGGTTFNWSEVAGNGAEAALSNAYYPPQERSLSQTARNWATQMESAALNNIAKEFWPDIRRKILRRN